MDNYNLQRFIDAQDAYGSWKQAMQEVKAGQKVSHWIWYVYPQLKGLGRSSTSQFYGLSGTEEAKAYLEDKALGDRLRFAVTLLIQRCADGLTPPQIFGSLDSKKVNSCLTLFDSVCPNDIFGEALRECYQGKRDGRTLHLLSQTPAR